MDNEAKSFTGSVFFQDISRENCVVKYVIACEYCQPSKIMNIIKFHMETNPLLDLAS